MIWVMTAYSCLARVRIKSFSALKRKVIRLCKGGQWTSNGDSPGTQLQCFQKILYVWNRYWEKTKKRILHVIKAAGSSRVTRLDSLLRLFMQQGYSKLPKGNSACSPAHAPTVNTVWHLWRILISKDRTCVSHWRLPDSARLTTLIFVARWSHSCPRNQHAKQGNEALFEASSDCMRQTMAQVRLQHLCSDPLTVVKYAPIWSLLPCVHNKEHEFKCGIFHKVGQYLNISLWGLVQAMGSTWWPNRINQCKYQILLSVPGNDFKNIVYLIKKIRKTNKWAKERNTVTVTTAAIPL